MTGREWKPGDVAMVTVEKRSGASLEGQTEHIAMRDRVESWASGTTVGRRISEDEAVAARPLVVVDPVSITGPEETGDDGDPMVEIAKCLRRLAEGDHSSSYRRRVAERLADVFDPPPSEPTGLGAVVVDGTGEHYVLTSTTRKRGWTPAGSTNRVQWAEIDFAPVRILSEGVPA